MQAQDVEVSAFPSPGLGGVDMEAYRRPRRSGMPKPNHEAAGMQINAEAMH